MAIKDDILLLKTLQETQYQKNGKYVQCLSTPVDIPTKGSVNVITELNKPNDEVIMIEFNPSAKDYQFRVDVWKLFDKEVETIGYKVTAKRDLGDNLVEIVTSMDNE